MLKISDDANFQVWWFIVEMLQRSLFEFEMTQKQKADSETICFARSACIEETQN